MDSPGRTSGGAGVSSVRGPAPPRPDPHRVAELHRGSSGALGGPRSNATPWKLTGQRDLRPGLFGRVVLWVEETRLAFRPNDLARSPDNWQEETRWRRATMDDLGVVP